MPAAAVASRSPRIIPFARMGDEALAGRAAAGDNAAASALCERYHEPLLGYCRSILLNADDAHDAAQSALENALRALPRREPGRPLKPWLYRIAHNESINIVRRRQPAAPAIETDDRLTVPGPEVDAEQRTRLAQLVDDLRMLPERQRGALVMRELSGLSYDEIALALGVSNEAARRAVFDARTALHDAVDGRATECTSVRHCLSDGDRRHLRARGVRAHLRSCDDCATFERAMGTRQTDLHMLGPWLAGGAGALGLLGYGAGTAAASALAASAAGGGAAAAGTGGLGWAGLPVAVKGLAVATVVATSGTAAVELPKSTRDASPPQSSARVAGPAATAISPRHDQVREHALAQEAAARRARQVGANLRLRARERNADAASGADRRRASPAAPAPVPAAPQPATSAPALHRQPAATAERPEQVAAEELQRVRERILDAFGDAQATAAPGTQSALTAANALIQSRLGALAPLLDDVLATAGLTLPSRTTTQPPVTSVTNVLAPAQSLLDGVDEVLQSMSGGR
ncbi:MAG: sigma-70 family RNA polymerase sigma factor [Actinobacteria bacterium]|nr:sigma-70 family RNA polymerase sigma factor [Actinomycetota bacterium]